MDGVLNEFFVAAVTRVGGNKKGVFTRARQPKESAWHIRKRYFALGKEIDNSTLPNDLNLYIHDSATVTDNRTEL